jgi:hypothetical protein
MFYCRYFYYICGVISLDGMISICSHQILPISRSAVAHCPFGGLLLHIAHLAVCCCILPIWRSAVAYCPFGGLLLHIAHLAVCCCILPISRSAVAYCPFGGLLLHIAHLAVCCCIWYMAWFNRISVYKSIINSKEQSIKQAINNPCRCFRAIYILTNR